MWYLRKWIVNGTLFLVSALIVIALCELSFRIALFSQYFSVPPLRQAWRYADGHLDDQYWKLSFLFASDKKELREGRIDPVLGWAPLTSLENPLGIHRRTPYSIDDVRERPVLFYGDSFVAGVTLVQARIPHVLETLIVTRPVLNYGVSGYGLDQIYLRFLGSVDMFEEPVLIVGILLDDLNRSALSLREYQKPFFEIIDDNLVLRNLPILPSTADYVRLNPPSIRSYFFRFVAFRLRPWLPADWFNALFGYDEQQEKIRNVNYKLLQAFKSKAETIGAKLYIVLFYSGRELRVEDWRETFIKTTLQELGLDYFDTKTYLMDYVRATDTALDDLYYAGEGHLNERGNKAIAKGLAVWLNKHQAL